MASEHLMHVHHLLVWGYIRNIQKMYGDLETSLEINDIIYLYQRLYDEWDEKCKSSDISINADKSWINVCGTASVTDGIFKWKIKIISFPELIFPDQPYVGIIIDNEQNLICHSNDVDFDYGGYLICGGDGDFYSMGAYKDALENCKWQKSGDILEMISDSEAGTLI